MDANQDLEATRSAAHMPTLDDLHLSPGTVFLSQANTDGTIILQPRPSEDPNDPLNWSTFRKTVNFALVLFYTLLGFAVVTIQTPLWGPINTELGFSFTSLTNAFATNVAGLGVGCVFFVPIALKYGRRPIYLTTTLLMLLSCVWQAKMTTLADLYLSVFLSGLTSSVNETLIQITVADLFFVHQRGTMNGIYILMVAIGNYLAPVASGYVANSQGWAWSYWWNCIFFGVANVLIFFFYEETKYITPPTISGIPQTEGPHLNGDGSPNGFEKTSSQDRTSGVDIVPTISHTQERPIHINQNIPLKTYRERLPWITKSPSSLKDFVRHVYQPFQVMVLFPIVAFTCFQYGTLIVWINILATTEASLFAFPPYNFGTIAIGNLNIASFIGFLIGSMFGGPISDLSIVRLAKRNNGIYEPEMRLHLYIIPAVATSAGLFMYGLTLAKGMHWILPAVGSGIMSFGVSAMLDINLNYLIDAHREIVGDALVAVTFVRNVLSTVIIFALPPWEAGMSLQNMFILMGVLSLAFGLLYIPMQMYGKRVRIACARKYAIYTARQFSPRMD